MIFLATLSLHNETMCILLCRVQCSAVSFVELTDDGDQVQLSLTLLCLNVMYYLNCVLFSICLVCTLSILFLFCFMGTVPSFFPALGDIIDIQYCGTLRYVMYWCFNVLIWYPYILRNDYPTELVNTAMTLTSLPSCSSCSGNI